MTSIDFVNVPQAHSLDSLHKMVAENGGTFSMNLNNSVTHCIAAESKGLKFQAAKLRGDIIHYSWLFDCCSQKKLLPLQPKYFLSLSDSSKKKLQEEIDELSDPYYWDLDIEDIKQLLSNINRSEDPKTIDYYKRKFCPKDKWSCFHGCCIYFHPSAESSNLDSKVLIELALRRMRLAVAMGGGKVSNSLSQATHLVVISPLGFNVEFDMILRSFSSAEVHLLHMKSLHVVGLQWLEDCLDKEQKLQEAIYSLKPAGFKESNLGEWKHDPSLDDLSSMDIEHRQKNMLSSPTKDREHRKSTASLINPRLLTSAQKDGKRERGRPTSKSINKRKLSVIQPRRTRARLGSKSAKICETELDVNVSPDKNAVKEEPEIEVENHEIHGIADQDDRELKGKAIVEDCYSSQKGIEDSMITEQFDRAHGIELGSENNAHDGEKLEVMVDPVQSMLLDMIPSLGTKKVDSIDRVVEEPVPPEHNTAETLEKKKVSYKDLATELLRDW